MFVIRKKSIIFISIFTAVAVLALWITVYATKPQAAASTITVVVDAGHGGVDAGAVGASGSHESQINLSVSKKLEKRLTAAGIRVVMTRTTSDGLYGTTDKGFKNRDMQKRRQIIEDAVPHAVISVHMNKSEIKSVRGAQVFYHKNSEKAKQLATYLQKSLNDGMEYKRPRTVLTGDYFMLNCTSFTSVIVECGFVSNEEEEKLLLDDDYQEKIAQYIAEGFLTYLSATTVMTDTEV